MKHCALMVSMALALAACSAQEGSRSASLWGMDAKATPLAVKAEKVLVKACPGLADAAATHQLMDVTSGLQRTVGLLKRPDTAALETEPLSAFGIVNVVNVNVAFKATDISQGATLAGSVCTYNVSNFGIEIADPRCRRVCGVAEANPPDRLPLPPDTSFKIDEALKPSDTNESLRRLRVQ